MPFKKAPLTRMNSLDAFRGITVVMMILVNNPGSWNHVYAPLMHADWNGWTLTDLVFPFFIFIMGVSIVLALSKKIAGGSTHNELYRDICNRAFKLFVLGLVLNLLSINLFSTNYHWVNDTLFNVRVMGVLQRLAIVYAITAIMFIHFKASKLVFISLFTLLVYWITLLYVPFSVIIDGVNTDLTGTLEHGKNFTAYVDNLLLGSHHVYFTNNVTIPYDPEGFFSTLTATVTCIIGVLTGLFLQKKHPLSKQIFTLFFVGIILILCGEIMAFGFPINKTIWSPSYVILMAGMALLFLVACMYIIDLKGFGYCTTFLNFFGIHAIGFFMFSGVLGRILLMIKIGDMRLRDWLYATIFSPVFGDMLGSFMFSVFFLLFSYVILKCFYYRKRALTLNFQGSS